MTRVCNFVRLKPLVFDLRRKRKRKTFNILTSNEQHFVPWYQSMHSSPLIPFCWFEHFTLQTPPFLSSQITTSQWTKSCRVQTDIHMFIWKSWTICEAWENRSVNYLTTQVILIFSEGKHLDLEAFEVRRIRNSCFPQHRMEHHLVGVYWVCTAGRRQKSFNLIFKFSPFPVIFTTDDTSVQVGLPVDDEVPSGFGRPVVIQRRPAVLQLQGHFGIGGTHQLDLKIQRLL